MTPEIATLLDTDDEALALRWDTLCVWIRSHFKREASLEGVLFLIGIQERGKGFEPKIPRHKKEAIIMDGTYLAFETIGLYRRTGMEADGAWIWERVIPLPGLDVEAQEKLLKLAVLRYFEESFQDR